MKRLVDTDDAPAAVGAYSQATTNGDLLFTAGQLPLTTDGELLDGEPVSAQTEQCLENVEAILAAEGFGLGDVLKTTIYLDDIEDFEEMNETYAGYFESEPPARSAVEVGNVPKGAAVEIEVVADATPD
ncbi:Rid family detoxifying hydrolase [Salinirubellus sp. GCM10025818]|uniref:Rid family detoxifying hydrolase n=1 Tax=Salinirubellus TaxID=2162630 RepID=UPI0030D313FF